MRKRPQKTISKVKVGQILRENSGKFFSCQFVKVDGSKRKMSCRTGVTRHLKGGANKVQKLSNDYITVWDREKESYRTINLSTMTRLVVRGVEYNVR